MLDVYARVCICTVVEVDECALGICESSDVTKPCRLGLTSKDMGPLGGWPRKRSPRGGPMLQLKGLLLPGLAGGKRAHSTGPRAHRSRWQRHAPCPIWTAGPLPAFPLMRALPGPPTLAVVRTVSLSHPQPAIPSRMIPD